MMEFGFVDCHCHIAAREFEEDLDDVIQRTKQACVNTLVTVVEEAGEFLRVLQLQESEKKTHKVSVQMEKSLEDLHPLPSQLTVKSMEDINVYPDLVAPCFGIHPLQTCGGSDQHSATPQDLDPVLLQFYNHRERLVAVGEIGLDFTPWCAPTQQDRDDQMKVFIKQLNVSKELDLPVNVHSRSAAKVTMETMKQQGVSQALLHNFAGKPSVALEGVKAGYFFSFPPAVCRNQQRDKLIRQIPLEHICLETDSPALGLDKYERNEPSNISLSCSYIAKVKGLSPETVQMVTTQNAHRLFPKISRRSDQSHSLTGMDILILSSDS